VGEVVVMVRGEIWWGEAPTAKGRPYLVLSRTVAIPLLNELMVAPITTRLRTMPSAIHLGRGEGLHTDCIANFDAVGSIRRSLLTRRLGALGPERMHEICAAMAAAIDC
jgi:mRNA interferase MazF